ncbi:hypothetical protein Tco_1163888 [Tanacetum coccineum]
MYDIANLHGLLEVYVSHKPQFFLIDFYFKNLCVDESDEEVTSQLRSHKKIKKDVDCMSLEEMIAWEQEETQSPCYLISPNPLKPKSLVNDLKGKSLLDDFDDVEGEGFRSSSSNFLSSSSPRVNGRALTELMQLSGETKIPDFKLFINQHITKENLFIKVLRDQDDDVSSRLTKINIMKHEMEAMEDQDAVFDSLVSHPDNGGNSGMQQNDQS